MGMVLDPQFTTGRPYVYVAYTYDAAIGGTAPRWNDNCPDPPGAERDGCVVSGRLSKILPDGTEVPLITRRVVPAVPEPLGRRPAVRARRRALRDRRRRRQLHVRRLRAGRLAGQPVRRPPARRGPAPDAADRRGRRAAQPGRLRTTGDPTGLDGAIIRVDPDTGDPLPTNPGTGDLNRRRIVAYGLRNPFRFAFRPGTGDIYVGDVGWLDWEEINAIPERRTSRSRNYGWPCYEGSGRQSGYDALGLNLCNNLYASGTRAPAAVHLQPQRQGRDRELPDRLVVGLGRRVLLRRHVPARLRRRDVLRRLLAQLHLGDVPPARTGRPTRPRARCSSTSASTPVDLEMGPAGDLYYADVGGGTIKRIRAIDPNRGADRRVHGDADRRATRRSRCRSTPPARRTRTTTRSRTRGTSTATARSTTRRPPRRAAPTRRTGTSPSACGSRDPGGLADTEQTELTVGTPPVAADLGADRQHDLRRRRPRGVLGQRHHNGSPCRPRSCAGPSTCTTARRSTRRAATSTTSRTSPASRRARSSTPTTSTRRTSSLGLTATATSGLRGTTSVRLDPKTVELTFESVAVGPAAGRRRRGLDDAVHARRSRRTRRSASPRRPTSSRRLLLRLLVVVRRRRRRAPDHGAERADDLHRRPTSRPSAPSCRAWSARGASTSRPATAVLDSSGARQRRHDRRRHARADGRFGRALSFDGTNDMVTIADSMLARPRVGHDARGVGEPDGARRRGGRCCSRSSPATWPTRCTRTTARAGRPATSPSRPTSASPARRCRSTPGPTWPSPTTARSCGCTRTARRSRASSSAAASRSSSGALRIGGNTVWDGVLRRPDRRRARLQPRAHGAPRSAADMTRAINCAGVPGAPSLSVTPASALVQRTAEPGPAPRRSTSPTPARAR